MELARKGDGLAEIDKWTEALKQNARIWGVDDPLILVFCQAAQWPG